MKLTFNNIKDRFETISSFAEKDLSKNAGFKWDPTNRIWYSASASSALRLKEYADVAALLKIAEINSATNTSMAASFSTDSDIEIPVPSDLSYLPYQRAGIDFAASRKSTLIADEMGLGKTIQALGLINFDSSISRALIICPAGLRLNWEKEGRKWLVRKPDIFRAGKKGLPSFTDGILVLGYEEATKYASVLGTMCWDLICCDEAHYLKNPKAKRTKAILAIPAARWVLLTGTPILNRPVELFPLLQKVDPHGLGSEWFSYVKSYCGAYKDKWGWKVDGASNLDELNVKLRTGGMIRREKKEVLKELPDKRRSLIPLEPTPEAARIIKEEKRKSLERVKALRKAKALERKDKVAFASDIEQLKDSANQIEFVEMARIRHELALSKVDQVVEYAADALASEPVIVFAHHLDVIEALAFALAEKGFKVAKVVGGGGADARNAIVESFQEGELDVVVCGIKAAAEGLTLTRASHTIFAELDWSPGKIDQAEDRCHRIGQKNAVVADWLVLEGSLEAHIAKTAVRKRKDADEALGAGMTLADVVQEIETPAPLFSKEDFEAAQARDVESEKQEEAAKVVQAELAQYSHLTGNFALERNGVIQTFWINGKSTLHRVVDRAETLQILKAYASAPEVARRAYANKTGKCYHCNRALVTGLSKYLGIGPDCGNQQHEELKAKLDRMYAFPGLVEEMALAA